ncbi:MAG: GNAT family N-acetyltransferase [Ignavibacteria bacterium]|nr:GNAT family N-acetyltransferase [Ignavibacteria bacterium]
MKTEVVPYDPAWKDKYLNESLAIKQKCGDKILIIEHAGSTSIEGMAAKPVIDIYIGTRSLSDAHSLIIPLTELGYEYYKDFEDVLPFRRYFRKFVDGKRSFHIHATHAGHYFRNIDLIFRDYVSENNHAAKEYEDLKLKLAEIDFEEPQGYNHAKDELCLRLKAEALKFFGDMFERTESEATNLMHKFSDESSLKRAEFKMLREGNLTAIRSDIFPGFSLNRALGISKIDNEFLDGIEEFYKGKPGKFALQIPPELMNQETEKLLSKRNYSSGNSWVTFYRDTSPIDSKGTDLDICEISKEHAADFAYILNEVFTFPHEFDGVAASTVGTEPWVHFMAFDKDKPAGSAGVCITGETAYLSFANVLPEYRNRGIQGELLKLRTEAARKRGVKWIFVDTGEDSEEDPNPSYWNILRCGFRLMYNRPNYVKVNEPEILI